MRALAAAMLPLVPLLFALGRPVGIDDPLFLKAAAQIRVDPSRPYDAMTYWYETPGPLWEIAKNPPGISYWLALVQTLGGQSEVAWHLAMLPFTVTAVGAGVWLARRFVGESGWSTAVWVASPAFLVSASTLMPDVSAASMYCVRRTVAELTVVTAAARCTLARLRTDRSAASGSCAFAPKTV